MRNLKLCTHTCSYFLDIICVLSATYPELQHSSAVYNAVIFGNNIPQRLRDSLPGRYEGKTRSALTNCPWSRRMGDVGDNKSV